MNKIVKILIVLACTIISCSNTEQLCGGYSEQRIPTDEELVMFRTVTQNCDMTLTPKKVATQVVAGTNYKFFCRYTDNSGSGKCDVIIYRPLQGEPELTGIKKY